MRFCHFWHYFYIDPFLFRKEQKFYFSLHNVLVNSKIYKDVWLVYFSDMRVWSYFLVLSIRFQPKGQTLQLPEGIESCKRARFQLLVTWLPDSALARGDLSAPVLQLTCDANTTQTEVSQHFFVCACNAGDRTQTTYMLGLPLSNTPSPLVTFWQQMIRCRGSLSCTCRMFSSIVALTPTPYVPLSNCDS